MTTHLRSLVLLLGLTLAGLVLPGAGAASADDPGTGSIAGTLTDSTGAFADGTVVALWQQQDDGAFDPYRYAYQGTEVPGRYLFGNLPPGSYHVYFYRHGDQTGAWFPSSPDAVGAGDVTVVAGQTATVDAASTPGASIRGTVTAPRGFDRGTLVEVFRQNRVGGFERVPYDTSACCEYGGPGGAEASQTDGRFLLRGLQPGTYRLYLPGYYTDDSRHNDLRPIWFHGGHSLATATDVVVAAQGSVSGLTQAMVSNAAEVVRRPRLTGRAQVGHTLHVTRGRYRPGPIRTRTYHWYVGRRRIAHVDGPSLRLGAHLRGRIVSVRVFAIPSAAAHYPTTPSRPAGPVRTRLHTARPVRGR